MKYTMLLMVVMSLSTKLSTAEDVLTKKLDSLGLQVGDLKDVVIDIRDGLELQRMRNLVEKEQNDWQSYIRVSNRERQQRQQVANRPHPCKQMCSTLATMVAIQMVSHGLYFGVRYFTG